MMYLAIPATVIAIHIIEEIRCHIRVIKRGVVNALLLMCAALHLDFVEFGVPCLLSLLPQNVEVPARHFGFHVLPCALHAHRAHTDRYHQWRIEWTEIVARHP